MKSLILAFIASSAYIMPLFAMDLTCDPMCYTTQDPNCGSAHCTYLAPVPLTATYSITQLPQTINLPATACPCLMSGLKSSSTMQVNKLPLSSPSQLGGDGASSIVGAYSISVSNVSSVGRGSGNSLTVGYMGWTLSTTPNCYYGPGLYVAPGAPYTNYQFPGGACNPTYSVCDSGKSGNFIPALAGPYTSCTPSTGKCGSANGVPTTVKPSANLCDPILSAGLLSGPTSSGSNWVWQCKDLYDGGPGSCLAPQSSPDCTGPDGTPIPNGTSKAYYDVVSSTSCSTHWILRTCTAGVLSGSSTFQYPSCTPITAACTQSFSATCRPGGSMCTSAVWNDSRAWVDGQELASGDPSPETNYPSVISAMGDQFNAMASACANMGDSGSGVTNTYTMGPNTYTYTTSWMGLEQPLPGHCVERATITMTGGVCSPAQNAACGPSTGGSFATPPTSGFCTVGTYGGEVDSVSGQWAWACLGINGGASVRCIANEAPAGGCKDECGATVPTGSSATGCFINPPNPGTSKMHYQCNSTGHWDFLYSDPGPPLATCPNPC